MVRLRHLDGRHPNNLHVFSVDRRVVGWWFNDHRMAQTSLAGTVIILTDDKRLLRWTGGVSEPYQVATIECDEMPDLYEMKAVAVSERHLTFILDKPDDLQDVHVRPAMRNGYHVINPNTFLSFIMCGNLGRHRPRNTVSSRIIGKSNTPKDLYQKRPRYNACATFAVSRAKSREIAQKSRKKITSFSRL